MACIWRYAALRQHCVLPSCQTNFLCIQYNGVCLWRHQLGYRHRKMTLCDFQKCGAKNDTSEGNMSASMLRTTGGTTFAITNYGLPNPLFWLADIRSMPARASVIASICGCLHLKSALRPMFLPDRRKFMGFSKPRQSSSEGRFRVHFLLRHYSAAVIGK